MDLTPILQQASVRSSTWRLEFGINEHKVDLIPRFDEPRLSALCRSVAGVLRSLLRHLDWHREELGLRLAHWPTRGDDVLCPHLSRTNVVSGAFRPPRRASIHCFLHSPRVSALPVDHCMRTAGLLRRPALGAGEPLAKSDTHSEPILHKPSGFPAHSHASLVVASGTGNVPRASRNLPGLSQSAVEVADGNLGPFDGVSVYTAANGRPVSHPRVRSVLSWGCDRLATDSGCRQSAVPWLALAVRDRHDRHDLDSRCRRISSAWDCRVRALSGACDPAVSRDSVEQRDHDFANHCTIQLWHLSHSLSHHALRFERSSVSTLQSDPSIPAIEALRPTSGLFTRGCFNSDGLVCAVPLDRESRHPFGA